MASFFERNGWYPIIILGNSAVSDSVLCDEITLSKTENNAAEMTFTIKLGSGVVDPTKWVGKRAQLVMLTEQWGSTNMFSGYVNIPEVDILKKKIRFICSDNRRERMMSQTQITSIIRHTGYYSEEQFGVAADLAEEIEKRLSTIPYALDVDNNGICRITDIRTKATNDFIFTNNDVYREDGRDPQVTLPQRTDIVNKIIVRGQYRYLRGYHREVTFRWTATYANNPCDFLAHGYSVASREMVYNAASSIGWPIRGQIAYTPVLAAGFYRCNGGLIAWATAHFTSSRSVPQTVNIRTSDGQLETVTKTDPKGNILYQAVPTGVVDTGGALCFGAQWIATKRWTQSITEDYTFTVSNADSISQYGLVEQDTRISAESNFDGSVWENYNAWRGRPTKYPVHDINDKCYYVNFDTNKSGWNLAVLIGINQAYTSIIRAHRATRVVFETKLNNFIDLFHTCYVNCTKLQARGKVYSLNHVMDINTGYASTQVTLALSKINNASSSSNVVIPSRPSYNPDPGPGFVNLRSYYGLEPQPEWTGHIGNKLVTTLVGSNTWDTRKTNYPHLFVVDSPQITPNTRENVTLTKSASYNCGIQDDLLTITF